MIATAPGDAITIRPARADETTQLEQLIAASARALGVGFYTEAETEAAIAHVFGVDSELVADGTYLVVEDERAILACGGWSRRETLFGGDRYANRSSALLDPTRDAARVRAFFVAPEQARRGVGSRLLAACEDAARAAGFSRTSLMATLPGVPFYTRHGYRAQPVQSFDLSGTAVAFVPMDKSLLQI